MGPTKNVDFSTAKLLKEKGFNLITNKSYYVTAENYYLENTKIAEHSILLVSYSAPTIAEVVMWLYETHYIWIMVDMTGSKKFYPRGRMIDKKGKHHVGDFKYNNERLIYNSPTEAYEAAILYTLKNLIK